VASAGRHPQFRHVQVGLFDLVAVDARQPDLFFGGTGDETKRSKSERLWSLIDNINTFYGRETLTLASQLGQQLHYAGAKIAFNRVPDAEFADSMFADDAKREAMHMLKSVKARRSAGWGRTFGMDNSAGAPEGDEAQLV
jgi:hypothetical protein